MLATSARSLRTAVVTAGVTDSAGEFAVLLRASFGELRRLCREMLANSASTRPVAPNTLVSATALRMLGVGGVQDLAHRGDYFSRLAGELRRELGRTQPNTRPVEVAELGISAVPANKLAAAIDTLEAVSPQLAQVASLRILAGMNAREIADELAVTRAEAEAAWQSAREFMLGFLN